jgi:protein-tyrosine phosphatase
MKILMVCLGNICRSPLAHGILSHLVKEEGLDWTVESAGTGDWHVGQRPDRRSIAVAKKYEVDISQQRAMHFNPSLFGRYDHILVMDHQNYKDVVAQASTKEEKDKVTLFLVDDIVPDPYFDESLFEPVFKMIETRCKELIQKWK